MVVSHSQSRRSFLKVGGASGASGLLAGCLGGDDNEGGTTTGTGGGGSGGGNIVYLCERATQGIIEEIARDFEDDNPDYTVEIVRVKKGVGGTDAQLQKMKAAGNPPDMMWHTITSAAQYQREGSLEPITDIADSFDVPVTMDVSGDSYFLPIVIEPSMAWYRTEHFDEAPQTQEELLSKAEEISSGSDTEGFIAQNGQTNNSDMMMLQHLWANNVNLFAGSTDDIKVVVDKNENRENAIQTFQWFKDIAEYSPNANGWEWGEATTALRSNDAASHMSIGIDSILINANQPEELDNIFPSFYPTAQNGNMDKWFTYFEGNVVRNDGDNTEGAKQFIEYMSNSSKIMDFVLTAPVFQLPPTQEGLNSDKYQSNDMVQRYPQVTEMSNNNWDSMQAELLTTDDGAVNPVAATSQIDRAKGRTSAQLLVNDKSPKEAVDFLAQKLRSYK